jgi:SpoVK/Ycf46/Vps4 family AAA+-type ATPase
MVSVGELGTDAGRLEDSLNRILDLAHTWGAIMLFDEADVFLERRQNTDIHRNALVSVFLRLLEYFQGILFLTTNRVETFDEAFQSRIHLALKYGELSPKARKSVWKMFIERVQASEVAEVEAAKTKKECGEDSKKTAGDGVFDAAVVDTAKPPRTTAVKSSTPFTEADYDVLARKVLNGRQIKNVARTAQALALNESKAMNMEHVKKVLEVQEAFENDLKGGSGFQEAMRSYT